MFRLSNLVTALFGVIAALGTIFGIGSISSANRSADTSPNGDSITAEQLSPEQFNTAGETSSIQGDLALSSPRQVGQNLANQGDATTTPETATESSAGSRTTAQNPSAPFVVQGEGAVLDAEPAPPATPSEATAVQLDPSPGAAAPSVSATAPSQPPSVQPSSEPASNPAPRTVPVRAMW